MKKHLHNSLRALLLSLAVLMSLPMLAVEVEIDGVNYELVSKVKRATVIKKSSGEYSGEIVIPESVEHEGVVYTVDSMAQGAFSSCYGLTSVIIGNNVTRIAGYTFEGCSGLTSVTIGNSVKSIGGYAFYNCSALTSIAIPNSVKVIEDRVFAYCSGLTSVHISDIAAWCNIEFKGSNPLSVAGHLYLNGEEIKDLVIPNSVTSIGHNAFGGCGGLTSVTIPNSVKSIGSSAFNCCDGLTSVTIGNGVTSIGEDAFFYCNNMISVTIGNSVTNIGDGAFNECSGLTSITIPNSVMSIGRWSFRNCTALTSLTIGNSVTSIRSSAFGGCSGLTSVTIPNSVTSIGGAAFYGCSGLTSLTIGNSVTSIGESAFANCPELLDVYCYAEKVPSTESDAFNGSYPEYVTLHVPDASIDSYKASAPWSGFGKIVALTPEETGIDELKGENGKVKTAVYDLSGRRVQKGQKGIFIRDGKVVVL